MSSWVPGSGSGAVWCVRTLGWGGGTEWVCGVWGVSRGSLGAVLRVSKCAPCTRAGLGWSWAQTNTFTIFYGFTDFSGRPAKGGGETRNT